MARSTTGRPGDRTAPAHCGRDARLVHLDEALVAEGLADLRWLLHDALLDGATDLVVDVSGVRHVSSTAVASLLWAHRTCRARGGAVVLRGVDRRTEGLLHRTGLWRVLRIERRAPSRSR